MKALFSTRGVLSRVLKLGHGVEIREAPIPTISDQQILVKVHAVAINPIDYKSIDLLAPQDSRLGCDYAGEVTKVGKSAKGDWKIGDRVAGMVHGGAYPNRGSFAEYLNIDGDLAWRIPEGTSDEEAATYGIPATTAMLALNVHLNVPWMDEAAVSDKTKNPPSILIYSGSTAVGLFALQIAKAAGYRVITTASPHSFDLVKSYGADSVFNYRDPNAIRDITTAFPDIRIALDCISEGSSSHFCAQVMKNNGGKVILVGQGKSKVQGVTYVPILIFTAFGEAFSFLAPIGPKFPQNLTDRQALARFYANLPSNIQQLKAPPTRILNGGFDAILQGIDELREGKVSGKKLVVVL